MLGMLGAVGGIVRGIFLLIMAAVWGGCAFIARGNGAPPSAVAGIAALAVLSAVGGLAVILRGYFKLKQRPDPTEAAEWKWRQDDLAHDDAKDRADAVIAKYMRDRSGADGASAADGLRSGTAPVFGRAVR